ncbi:HlyD family efflux transporter periplasmic adaptor subunit [Thalassotalea maritima]|uniref:HlyD family efflux transporter periplasmic adaptor subunit n=1 Tax=Thalassotalea maritima TaxID=3242416 RepID=UPI0035298BE3
MSLFRKEVLAHQSQRLSGAIALNQPLSIKVSVGVLLAVTLLIIVFLSTAEYARKQTVRGFLAPDKGMIKSFAQQGGTIEKLWVDVGSNVQKGDALATLIIANNAADGIALNDKLQSQYDTQLHLLDAEIEQYKTIQTQQSLNFDQQLQDLAQEKHALIAQQQLTAEKLILLSAKQRDMESLKRQGYLSKFETERHQQALMDAQQEHYQISRLIVQQNNHIKQLTFEKANLPQTYTLTINQLLRQKADLQQQLAQINSSYRYTVVASQAGTVMALQVVEGQALSSIKAQSSPLMHILPEGAELIAELLLPTRSAGFVEQGQLSRLRFDAFPYQRFGFIESEIVRIDNAIVTPNEIQIPVALQEPVYRLKAKLKQQYIAAYGQTFDLRSGMLFEADIMLERRSLMAWLLEPIYSIQGRLG